MVFSSVPAYFDPPSWNQQQQPYEQPPSASSGGGGGGGEAGRPGSMSDHARLSKILPQPPSVAEPALKCPRCESTNTKFCYFNNYSLSQPRHFCKTCRRYWTRGGSLRNVPVGGGCRRNNKRTKSSSTSSSSSKPIPRQPATSTVAAATAANNNNLILPSHQFPFMNSFHPLNDYGGSGSNLNLGFAELEHGGSSSGAAGVLEHWKAQQMSSFPFLGRMEPSLPTPPVGLPMTGIVMQAAAAAAAKVEGTNMEQMSSLPGNDQYNYWGGGHGNGWSTSELASGFNSLSSGNFL